MLVGVDELPVEDALRPLHRTDAAGMLNLLRAMDVAETGSPFTSDADVTRILGNGRIEFDRDSRAVSDPRGLAAFAAVETLEDREYVRATLGLRPDAAGVTAPVLLGWVERRAQEVALAVGWATATAVTWQLPGGLAAPALRERGWADVRRFNHLRGDLNPNTVIPTTPPEVLVDTATTDPQARKVHNVLEAALAGHWEHRPKTADRFLADERAAVGHDQSLWFLATVAGRPAAAVIARRLPEQGWIGWVGTQPEHRGRGLARLLLTTAMTELARRGCLQAALDVDTGNHSGALRLYESVGFRVEYQAAQWRFTTTTSAR